MAIASADGKVNEKQGILSGFRERKIWDLRVVFQLTG